MMGGTGVVEAEESTGEAANTLLFCSREVELLELELTLKEDALIGTLNPIPIPEAEEAMCNRLSEVRDTTLLTTDDDDDVDDAPPGLEGEWEPPSCEVCMALPLLL
jgi:hypothetical protein